MAFQYQGLDGLNQYQGIDYSTPEQPQQQSSPMDLAGMAQMLGGKDAASGEAVGGTDAVTSDPWAALAAVIIGNESESSQVGQESENGDGGVLQQVTEDQWLPKVFGGDRASPIGDMLSGTKFASGDFSDGWGAMKESGELGKILDFFRG